MADDESLEEKLSNIESDRPRLTSATANRAKGQAKKRLPTKGHRLGASVKTKTDTEDTNRKTTVPESDDDSKKKPASAMYGAQGGAMRELQAKLAGGVASALKKPERPRKDATLRSTKLEQLEKEANEQEKKVQVPVSPVSPAKPAPQLPPKMVTGSFVVSKPPDNKSAPPANLFSFVPGGPPPGSQSKGGPPPTVYEQDDPNRPKGANTSDEAVYRADGMRLYGLDAELAKKAQGKRDDKYERELLSWLEQVSGEKAEFPNDIIGSLKSGVLLCKTVNAIEPGTIKKIDTRAITLVFVENINNYLKACWKLGIPSSALFITSDLQQGKGANEVIQNIIALIRLAQSRPDWKGPEVASIPKIVQQAKPTKKWADVKTNQQYRTVEDIEREEEEARQKVMHQPTNSEEVKLKQKELENKIVIRNKFEKDIQEIEKKIEEMRKEKSEISLRNKKLENDNSYLLKQLESVKKSEQSQKTQTQDILNKRKALETNIVQLERDLKSETDAKNSAQQKLTEIENKIQLEKQAVAEAKKSYEAAKSQRIEMEERAESERLLKDEFKSRFETETKLKSDTNKRMLEQEQKLKDYEAKLAKKVKREEQRKSTKIKAGIGGSFDLGSKSFTMQTVPDAKVFVSGPKKLDKTSHYTEILQECLRNILFSKTIDIQKYMSNLKDFLYWEMGRRQFTRILRRTMKEANEISFKFLIK